MVSHPSYDTAHRFIDDVKGEAERLRSDDVDVGTVLEIHDEVRVVDVFDPDGNRLQLVEQLRL